MLIIPMDKRAATLDGAKITAKELSDIEAKLAPLGMHIGYHNHKAEMLDIGDTTPWDVIAKNTASSVVLQQDVGWTEAAGKNPVDILKHYPGRTIVTHYKAAAPDEGNKEDPIIGKDTTDWKSLIVANRTIGGTRRSLGSVENLSHGALAAPGANSLAAVKSTCATRHSAIWFGCRGATEAGKARSVGRGAWPENPCPFSAVISFVLCQILYHFTSISQAV